MINEAILAGWLVGRVQVGKTKNGFVCATDPRGDFLE
jgi:hypothetical protein